MPPMDGLHDICPKVSMLCVKQRRAAEAGRSQCCLGTGVTAADHDDVELARKNHGVRNFT